MPLINNQIVIKSTTFLWNTIVIQQSTIRHHMNEYSQTQITGLYYGRRPLNKYSKVIKGSNCHNIKLCPQQLRQLMKFSVLKQPKNIKTTRLTTQY